MRDADLYEQKSGANVYERCDLRMQVRIAEVPEARSNPKAFLSSSREAGQTGDQTEHFSTSSYFYESRVDTVR